MQEDADIYSLQSYSTCFGCHSTHHQEYQKQYPQPPVQVILLVPLLPSYVVWSGLVCTSRVVGIPPTCFDQTIILREHTLFRAKVTV